MGESSLATIHKARDNSVKAILAEPELFAEFIRDFTSIEILKDVSPEDIEDVTERFLSLVSEQKDGDTVKRINLKGGIALFVITIVEHESQVNFRASFKMLLYIALILNAYETEVNETEVNKETPRITQTRDFKYPPILPIIFYDGDGEWTAEMNFLNRTEMSDIFEKYIPKFEYELVSLKDYSYGDLAKFGNMLSLFMMISKMRDAEQFNVLKNIPSDYAKQFDSMNVPSHLKELLVKVITTLLTKINVPKNEIDDITSKIDERGVSEMLAIADYDVQATRRNASQQALLERLVRQIYRKKLKMKTREQIIDELELEANDIDVLDNFESYRHLV